MAVTVVNSEQSELRGYKTPRPYKAHVPNGQIKPYRISRQRNEIKFSHDLAVSVALLHHFRELLFVQARGPIRAGGINIDMALFGR